MRLSTRHGAAEIIGTVFALLIVFTVVFAGILTSYQLQNNYTSSVQERRQMDFEQESESLAVLNPLTSPGEQFTVSFQNTGPITITVAELFIRDVTAQIPHGPYIVNKTLNPGDRASVPTDVAFDPNKQYQFTAFTERGTNAQYLLNYQEELHKVNASGLTGAIGPILLQFGSLHWTSSNPPSSGQFHIPKATNKVHWYLNVTNMVEERIDFNLTSSFVILTSGSGPGEVKAENWYIDSAASLAPGQKMELHFWRKLAGSSTGEDMINEDASYSVFVVLIGYYPNRSIRRGFSETIPFQAVYSS